TNSARPLGHCYRGKRGVHRPVRIQPYDPRMARASGIKEVAGEQDFAIRLNGNPAHTSVAINATNDGGSAEGIIDRSVGIQSQDAAGVRYRLVDRLMGRHDQLTSRG